MNEPYDAKLPILAELERDVTRAAELALGGPEIEPRRAAPEHEARRRRSGRQGRRVARRALLLVALLLLIGASALAATGAFDGGGSDSAVRGAALDTIHGSAGGGYRLVLHPHGNALCRVLVTEGAVTSKCQRPPSDGQVEPLSAMGTDRRFVFGLTGPRTHSVEIRVGGHRLEVPTRPVDAAAARAAGIDPHVRVFVAAVTPLSGSASQPPAIVAGTVDCSLTTTAARVCRRP